MDVLFISVVTLCLFEVVLDPFGIISHILVVLSLILVFLTLHQIQVVLQIFGLLFWLFCGYFVNLCVSVVFCLFWVILQLFVVSSFLASSPFCVYL